MKKAILAALLCAALLSACGSPKSSKAESGVSSSSGSSSLLAQKDGVIEIKEKLFIAQTNEIYLNWQDYLGSTIRYEGIFDKLTYGDPPVDYYYVIRYGPGCCAYDSNAGFEVTWDGEIPEVNAWVESEGVL